MYTAPAEPTEAFDSSAQWLAAALAGAWIVPNVITAVTTAIAVARPGAAWMMVEMYAWAAAAYAVIALLIGLLATLFGRRLTSERRRLLVGASVSATGMGVVGAAWRFAVGPLPPLIMVVRDVSFASVCFAAGHAVAQLCATGFRRRIANVTAILACMSAFVAAVELLGMRIPLGGIADVGAWVGAVIALAVVPRRRSGSRPATGG
jgi:hypothetical protein